jgi:hypothetical protein
MAAPNIINVTSITGNSIFTNVGTGYSNVAVNAAASGNLYKINTIIASNKSTNPVDITVEIVRGTTAYSLAYQITVPDKATVVLSGKDTAFYLVEADHLRTVASAASAIVLITSYEIIA